MGKRLVIALVAVALFVVGGYLVYSKLFAGEPEPEVTRATDAGQVVDAAPPPVETIAVTRVEGTVERQGSDGDWQPVAVGESLAPDDIVRTGADGKIEFNLDGQIIGLDPGTTLELPTLANANLIRLDEGRLSATVADSGKPLRVEIQGVDAVAETTEGEFDVLARSGEATVAARAGEVDFSSAGKTVKVSKGKLSRVRKGSAPSAAAPIPKSLFLKVSRASKTRSKKHTIRGKTTPGAIISINGVVVRVDETGDFSQVVALREGRNKIEVVGRDVVGRTERTAQQVVVDTRPPSVGGEMTWGQ